MSRSQWHDEAKRMFAAGRSVADIASHFGKSTLYVNDIVLGRVGSGSDLMIGRGENSFIEPHKPRQVRQACLDTMAVCRAFAASQIDRAELSRRLRGQP